MEFAGTALVALVVSGVVAWVRARRRAIRDARRERERLQAQHIHV